MRNDGGREAGRAVAVFHDAKDVGASHQRGARIAAGDDLGQRRQVRRHVIEALRAARRAAEAADHFIEDEDNSMLRGDPPQFA